MHSIGRFYKVDMTSFSIFILESFTTCLFNSKNNKSFSHAINHLKPQ